MSNQLSYWEKESFFNYDIIIIGSGIVGLNTAIYLQEHNKNLRIAILESGFLPTGASTKNAGFACFGSISELIEQENTIGTDQLQTLIKKRWDGLKKLRDRLGDKQIDYQCLGGYELFKEEEATFAETCVSKIEHFNNLIQHSVGKKAFSLHNEKITDFGFKRVGNLMHNRFEAQIDTGKMMFGLLKYAQQIGISILNNCRVNDIEDLGTGTLAITNQGKFFAKKIAVTTNAFIKSLLPQIDIKPGRGQVLITKPIQNLKIAGAYHYDKGYYYFRNINSRILLGGGRNLDFNTEETTVFGETELIHSALNRLLTEVILPGQSFEIDYGWSGIMAFGKQLDPLINPVSENIFCATRCNGMGIAIGTNTGETLARLIQESL